MAVQVLILVKLGVRYGHGRKEATPELISQKNVTMDYNQSVHSQFFEWERSVCSPPTHTPIHPALGDSQKKDTKKEVKKKGPQSVEQEGGVSLGDKILWNLR